MTKAVLLNIVILCVVVFLLGCSTADMENPSANPLPGHGIDTPNHDEYIDANYAIDIIPEREIPDSKIIDDPEWEPLFDSLTEKPQCINEGCLTFKELEFDQEAETVTFKGTFFNPNKDSMRNLIVFFVITETTHGVAPIEPDGMWKLHQFDTKAYPFYTFSAVNNENELPASMYNYFEREITFIIEEGADFFINFEILAIYDTHDLSYLIYGPDPVSEEHKGSDEGDSTDDSDGREGGGADIGTPDSATPEYASPGLRPPV